MKVWAMRIARVFPVLGLCTSCTEPAGPHTGAGLATSGTGSSGTGMSQPTTGTTGSTGQSPTTGTGGTTPNPNPFDWSTLSAAQTEEYLRKVAPAVVGRVLSTAERDQIQSQKGKAIQAIVGAWVKEEGFIFSARRFLETSLAVSGKTPEGIDFTLPGNLAEYVVRNKRPWSEIITSNVCYDDKLAPTMCDTGAPYAAGVITTRAYMITRISRYNLQRASALLRNFACRQYPMEDELQPHVQRDWLIPMFQAQNAADQTDPRAKNGFGQGFACYTCHGQFSIHAQLFVKFDEKGMWQQAATGLQSETDELGRSANGTMASHFPDPVRAGSEGVNVFGTPVKNLPEAASVLAKSPTFVECAANRYLDSVLGVQSGTIEYNNDLFVDIGKRIRAVSPDPTFTEIANTLLTEPDVVRSIITGITGAAP